MAKIRHRRFMATVVPEAVRSIVVGVLAVCIGILAPLGVFGSFGPLGPAMASAAAATPPSWSTQADFQLAPTLDSISCPTATQCVAGGIGSFERTTDGGSTWQTESLPPALGSIGQIASLSCPTTSSCVAIDDVGQGLMSSDGGVTWQASVLPLPGELTAVSCVTGSSDCVAVDVDTSTSTFASATTTDGGVTWQAGADISGIDDLSGVSCLTSTACIAVGNSAANGMTVFSTTDGGQTWKSDSTNIPDIGIPGAALGAEKLLSAVSCVAPSTCVAVGAGTNSVMFSTDGGQTWQTSTIPASFEVPASVSCASASDCVAVGSTGAPPVGGAAITSTDGGQTWQAGTLPSGTAYLDAVSCATASQCEAGGEVTSGEAEFPLVGSNDGGAAWSSQTILNTANGIQSVSCPTQSRCYAVAPNALLTTSDGGTTWTQLGLPSGVFELESISCSSALDCLLTGGVGVSNPTLSLFATTDGGTTWQERTNPFAFPPIGINPASGIVCTPTLDCVAGTVSLSGLPPNYAVSGEDAFSADGGQTWSMLPVVSGTAGSPNLPFNPTALSCTSNSSCLVTTPTVGDLTSGGLSLVTSGGSMSQVLTSNAGDVSCPTSTMCFAVGTNSGTPSTGFISTSTDAGATWQSLTLPTGLTVAGFPASIISLSGVSCSSATDCVVVGAETEGGSDFPLILTTSDGGQTWQVPAVPNTVSQLAAVSCATSVSCTAVGIAANTSGGVIIGEVPPPPDAAQVVVPSSGATLSGTTLLDGGATNTSAVTTFQYELTGGSYTNQVVATAKATFYGWLAEEANGTVGWDSTSVPNGTYTLTAVATYNDGTVVTSPGVSITVSNPAPTAQVLIPSAGATVSGTTFLDGTASYTPNITQFTYDLDGTPVGNAVASPWGWLLLNWNTTTVANGSHTLTAVATYADGATATSPGVTVTVSNP
jgi:photosystem II stability/assembly factor-like uncharacterized protein